VTTVWVYAEITPEGPSPSALELLTKARTIGDEVAAVALGPGATAAAPVLGEHGAALCLADSPRRRTPLWRTAGWTYLRLHQGAASPRPCYGRRALATWAGRLADLVGPDADAYVYFNNDPGGCAVRDARVFALAAARAGLHPTRVPAAAEVRL